MSCVQISTHNIELLKNQCEITLCILLITGGFLGEDILMINMLTKVDNVGTTNKGEYIFVLDRSGMERKARMQSVTYCTWQIGFERSVNCYENDL